MYVDNDKCNQSAERPDPYGSPKDSNSIANLKQIERQKYS